MVLIIISAVLTSTGQLFWKLGIHNFIYICAGFLLYGFGAVLMIISFKFGEISVLHPMLSISYILSLILGNLVLGEAINTKKVIGIIFIICGTIFLGLSACKTGDKKTCG